MELMSYEKYETLIGRIENLVKYYEKSLSGNHYWFGLANGDRINLSFPECSIPHLLGVQIDRLKAAGLAQMSTASYEILKQLTSNKITYNSMRYSGFDINSLFSEYVDNKIDAFVDNFKVKKEDLYAVVKYCADRSYTSCEEKEISDYFIIKKRKDKTDYTVLGIKKNKNYGNDYVPVTSRLFKNYSELSEFLNRIARNQEVTYIASYKIENYFAQPTREDLIFYEDKQEYCYNLKDMQIKYKSIPAVLHDFSINIGKALNNRQANYNKNSILRSIRESIVSGSIINKEETMEMLGESQMPDELDTLIDACNDLICHSGVNSEAIGDSYSSMQNENTRLKEELKAMKEELLATQTAKEQLEEEVTGLREDNTKKEKKLGTLMDAYKIIMQEEE